MAKQKSKGKQLTRRQVARREREQRAQNLMMGIAIGVGAVILILLVYGLVTEVFIKARKPVARVGDVEITANEFKARQKYERWMTELEIYQYQSYLDQINAQPASEGEDQDTGMDSLVQQLEVTLANLERQLSPDFSSIYSGQVLDSMIEEELVRQEAESRGLTVSEDEIQEGIGLLLGFDPNAASTLTDTATITPTANATPTPLPEAQLEDLYQQFKTNVLQVTRYPEKDFRAMVRANLLREKIKAELAENVEPVQDQVETIFFALETEEDAEALRARINEAGEDPNDLLEELNSDESDQTSAFNLPWLPVGYIGGQFSPDIERVAFNTPVERASEPVTGLDERVYVIYVSGHEERELSPELLNQAENQAYEGWLSEAQQERSEYLDWEEAVIVD